jgi:apolipoprotein N-acyltransferase
MRQPPPAIPPAPAAPAVAAAPQPAKAIAGLLKLCFLVCFIFNILIAVWIFTDIRKRGEGSGIFIALALLAGVPAAIIYALVRIGDKKTEPAR